MNKNKTTDPIIKEYKRENYTLQSNMTLLRTITGENIRPHIEIEYSDGKKGDINYTRIANFINHGFPNSYSQKLKEKLIEDFKPYVFELSFTNEPTQEEIDIIYLNLYNTIQEKLKQARTANKKLLILAGDVHVDRHSILLGSLLLCAAKKNNINHYIAEVNNKTLFSVRCANLSPNYDDPLAFNVTTVRSFVYLTDTDLHMEVIEGDPDAEKKELELRRTGINKAIEYLNEHNVSIFGYTHLKDIMESKEINEKYHVLALNLAPSHTKSYTLQECPEHTEFAFNPNLISQLQIPGNVYIMANHEIRMAALNARDKFQEAEQNKALLKPGDPGYGLQSMQIGDSKFSSRIHPKD